MQQKSHIDYLLELGLNQLEAEVYVSLLPEEPMTAYRIGKVIGKPTANVYKAIEVLAKKGAVMIEEGKNRKCRAIDIETFIAQLALDFEQKSREALEALKDVKKEVYDEHIYQIESPALVIEKSRQMLAQAEGVVVVDAFPGVLELIKSDIEAAAERGVEVFVEAYSPIEIKGAKVAIPPKWKKTLDYWSSQQLNLVVDGKVYLVALLSQDLKRLHQANWSCNLYLACLMHSGRMSEHRLVSLLSAQSPEKIGELVSDETFFYNDQVSGVQELFNRYRKSDKNE